MKTAIVIGNSADIDKRPIEWDHIRNHALFMTTAAPYGVTFAKYQIIPSVYVSLHPECSCTEDAIAWWHDKSDIWVSRKRAWPDHWDKYGIHTRDFRSCYNSGIAAAVVAIEEYGADRVIAVGCGCEPGYMQLIGQQEDASTYDSKQHKDVIDEQWQLLADSHAEAEVIRVFEGD